MRFGKMGQVWDTFSTVELVIKIVSGATRGFCFHLSMPSYRYSIDFLLQRKGLHCKLCKQFLVVFQLAHF